MNQYIKSRETSKLNVLFSKEVKYSSVLSSENKHILFNKKNKLQFENIDKNNSSVDEINKKICIKNIYLIKKMNQEKTKYYSMLENHLFFSV
jgi:hypothetical protein